MNIQTPVPSGDDAETLYERDFAAWLEAQAGALQAREPNALDWENLAEEIESMGGNLLRELISRLSIISSHVIKLRLSHAGRPRAGWRRTIRVQRAEILTLVEQSPSLRRHLPDLPGKVFSDSLAITLDALEEHEPVRVPEYREAAKTLEPEPVENLLDRDWFPPVPSQD